MCNALRRDRLPDQRVVIRLDLTYPGLDEGVYITADAEAFVKWHAGQLSWAEARPHQARRRGRHCDCELRRVTTGGPAARR
jgi:hypothetical protein